MEKGYKFRIYPNAEQETLMRKTFGCVRYVYNRYLGKRIEAYKADKTTLGYNKCSADMTELKKEHEWLREPDKFALQSALKDLETAYQNFFRRVRNGEKPGYPRYKSKHDSERSYRSHYTNGNIEVCEMAIKLPKLGMVECRVSKRIEGRILSATVGQSASGKYYVSLCCADVETEATAKTGRAIGIDLGLKEFATDSNGGKYDNHKHYRENEGKMKRVQRRLSRKPKGSRNRNKARIRLATIHETIANRRMDDLHKLSHVMVKENDIICIEDLNVAGMVKNRRLAKSVSDVGWGEFVRQLGYKSERHGKVLVRIGRFYPSTQLCSECGHRNEALKGKEGLKIREWVCPACGVTHDRDVNAAKNILNEGLRIYAGSIG